MHTHTKSPRSRSTSPVWPAAPATINTAAPTMTEDERLIAKILEFGENASRKRFFNAGFSRNMLEYLTAFKIAVDMPLEYEDLGRQILRYLRQYENPSKVTLSTLKSIFRSNNAFAYDEDSLRRIHGYLTQAIDARVRYESGTPSEDVADKIVKALMLNPTLPDSEINKRLNLAGVNTIVLAVSSTRAALDMAPTRLVASSEAYAALRIAIDKCRNNINIRRADLTPQEKKLISDKTLRMAKRAVQAAGSVRYIPSQSAATMTATRSKTNTRHGLASVPTRYSRTTSATANLNRSCSPNSRADSQGHAEGSVGPLNSSAASTRPKRFKKNDASLEMQAVPPRRVKQGEQKGPVRNHGGPVVSPPVVATRPSSPPAYQPSSPGTEFGFPSSAWNPSSASNSVQPTPPSSWYFPPPVPAQVADPARAVSMNAPTQQQWPFTTGPGYPQQQFHTVSSTVTTDQPPSALPRAQASVEFESVSSPDYTNL